MKWNNISYPTINGILPEWIYKLWKKFCCPKGWHLLDESWMGCLLRRN